MKPILIKVTGTTAEVSQNIALTTGLVGQPITFTFCEAWDGLSKTVVFRSKNTTYARLGVDDTTTIPPEILRTPNRLIEVGVYGYDAEGKMVIPTIWARLGTTRLGAYPSGQECADPTLPVWAQLDARIGSLEQGGTGGGSPTAKVEETAEGVKITITDKNGTTTAIVKNGEGGTGGSTAFVERAKLTLGTTADSIAIDTVAKTMTIPKDTIIWYGTTKYVQTTAVTIDLNKTSTAMCVLFNYKNNTFRAEAYNSAYCTMADQYVNICTFRRRSDNNYVLDIGVPYRVDGKLFGVIEQAQYEERTLSTIKMIAHRGISTYETGSVAPENTLPAIRQAAKNGYKYVEFDVRFTSDNIPVLIHNANINECARNADGSEITETVNVADKTLEELRAYDFGIFRGEQYAGTKIPTFEEALSACRKLGLHPYIEVKSATEAQVQQLASTVKKLGFANDCTWLISPPMAQHLPSHSRIGWVSNGNITEDIVQIVLSAIGQGHSVFLDVSLSGITDAGVQMLADNNIPLELWTVYSKSNIPDLVDYATGVTAECGAYYLANEIFDSEANKAVTEL